MSYFQGVLQPIGVGGVHWTEIRPSAVSYSNNFTRVQPSRLASGSPIVTVLRMVTFHERTLYPPPPRNKPVSYGIGRRRKEFIGRKNTKC